MQERDRNLRKRGHNSDLLLPRQVKEELATRQQEHGWEMLAEDQRWVHPDTGREECIDLVLHKHIWRVVLACQQERETQWVFLATQDVQHTVADARLLVLVRQSSHQIAFDHPSLLAAPPTPQSGCCIMRGQGEQDASRLDRLARGLLQATERFAEEESGRTGGDAGSVLALYIPVLVTTAELLCCPGGLSPGSLADGHLPEDTPVESVDIMRFCTSVAVPPRSDTSAAHLHEAHPQAERTVFVVHTTALVPFLKDVFII